MKMDVTMTIEELVDSFTSIAGKIDDTLHHLKWYHYKNSNKILQKEFFFVMLSLSLHCSD